MARMRVTVLLVCVMALAGGTLPAFSQQTDTNNNDVLVTTLAEGLNHPWGMAFLPNGDMVITERVGNIRRLSKTGKLSAPFSNVPDVVANNQGGMLDIVLDPQFAENHTIYFCFSQPGKNGSSSSVAKAVLHNDSLQQVRTIFSAQPYVDNGFHFGCRLAFNNNNELFITLGDRYTYMHEAQNTNNHLGTIVRINRDGSVPVDNPFKEGSAPEVFSFGHRNVQGITVHPKTGEVWAMEHGPKGGDEVNLLEKGANYGWPVITYGIDYNGDIISDKTHMDGMKQPVLYWNPSIAPSGMTFYKGDLFSSWKGDLLVGSLKFTHLRRIEMNQGVPSTQHEYLRAAKARIRDVEVGPQGAIYVLTDAPNGKVLKLTPAD